MHVDLPCIIQTWSKHDHFDFKLYFLSALRLLCKSLGYSEAWIKQFVPRLWWRAGGIFIPKEKDSVDEVQFRSVSILSECLPSYPERDKPINTLVQKAETPGVSGCLEHTTWSSAIKFTQQRLREETFMWYSYIWFCTTQPTVTKHNQRTSDRLLLGHSVMFYSCGLL